MFIESLARLNHLLKNANSDVTVVAFLAISFWAFCCLLLSLSAATTWLKGLWSVTGSTPPSRSPASHFVQAILKCSVANDAEVW